MAGNHDTGAQTDHRATYESFTGFMKWGTIAVVAAVLGLYVFVA